MKSNRYLWTLLIISLILLMPLVAMQFTDEVNWTGGDFAVAAVLLFATFLGIELIVKLVKQKTYRTLLMVGALALLVLVWAELAVGILGTPLAGS